MISITSSELNYLIFRYLQESGFTHSAFALGYEAGVDKSTIDGNLVPPGALVTFIQKGIQYLELEANLSCNDADMDEDFSFLQPLDLITKDVYELQKIIKEKKESQKTSNREKEKANDVSDNEHEREHAREREKELEREHIREREKKREREHARGREKELEREHAREREKEKQQREKDQERDRERIEKEREREKGKDKGKPHDDLADVRHDGNKRIVEHEENRAGPEPMEIEANENLTSSTALPCIIPTSDMMVLEGHASEVFVCAWSPSGPLLASGAGDSTARIWTIGDGPCRSNMQSGPLNSVVLKHFKGSTIEKNKDVTTLDWNGEGTFLATGSYDGQARVWNRDGELVSTMNKHKGPIFSLKWNKRGDYLLSGSVDKTAIVWDVKKWEWKQQFEFHSAPTLDVDWRNSTSFATCSTDTMIYVCKVGEKGPIKTFAGHQGEVNAVKWDPTGSLLASCSDDSTAKIWSMKQETYLHDLREHAKEIYTIKWSPTGPDSNNPNLQLLLASASFDSTVKLWDVESGGILYSLNGHRDPVYTVAFSPNGEYLASGSLDKCMHIWSVKEGRILKTFTGNGGIFEVCWNKEGDKIAACFANNIVCVLDFRM